MDNQTSPETARRLRESGARIAIARYVGGMTQPVLAGHLGINVATLANYEQSQRNGRVPGMREILLMIDTLGPTVDFATGGYFLGLDPVLDTWGDLEAMRERARGNRDAYLRARALEPAEIAGALGIPKPKRR